MYDITSGFDRPEPADAAAAGAALLDERIPNWAERIDILDLDLSSTSMCVLGQVFADEVTTTTGTGWGVGMNTLLDGTGPWESIPYGFERRGLGDAHQEYAALREAWVPLIEARQNA